MARVSGRISVKLVFPSADFRTTFPPSPSMTVLTTERPIPRPDVSVTFSFANYIPAEK
ncbi:MAG: hypothetical protein L6420_01090 [Elusimicrobia bacterium]|nr:hypothetical protein [Elusimicrobiota bacterium]